MVDSGTPAPDFALPDEQGRQVRLSALRGSWVVLWWFPKASTGG
jgi:peroxiredoxin Q/BCP